MVRIGLASEHPPSRKFNAYINNFGRDGFDGAAMAPTNDERFIAVGAPRAALMQCAEGAVGVLCSPCGVS